MTVQDVVFVLLASAGGLSAVLVVTSRNLVHAALFLGATLASVSGIFLVLHADFVGLVQLLIYVGAITVLLLFGLMLTRAPIGREALDSQQRGLGLAVATAMFGVLTALIVQAFGDVATPEIGGPSISVIGEALFETWVLPFELLSLLLLAALIGAILLARRESGETGEPEAPSRIALAEPPSPRGVEPPGASERALQPVAGGADDGADGAPPAAQDEGGGA